MPEEYFVSNGHLCGVDLFKLFGGNLESVKTTAFYGIKDCCGYVLNFKTGEQVVIYNLEDYPPFFNSLASELEYKEEGF